jgi:hypothetical protein
MHAIEQEYTGGPAWHIAGRIVDAAAYAAACRTEASYWDGRAEEADRSAFLALLSRKPDDVVANFQRDAAHYGRLALAWRARADAALAAGGGAR